ncbi:hypothetical protein [Nonomuraea sp. NPDC049504]|jgi:hypothetical protein
MSFRQSVTGSDLTPVVGDALGLLQEIVEEGALHPHACTRVGCAVPG